VIDIAIVVVLVGALSAFVVLRAEQHRDDDAAADIAAWAEEQGIDRVAWPIERRGAVAALLAAGVTPVLYDPEESASQDAAVNDTGVLVTDDPDDFEGLQLGASDRFEAGGLTAALVDVEFVAGVPVEPGRRVGQEISRPFVYAPIADPLPITAAEPFSFDVELEAGRYVFEAAVFDPADGLDVDPGPVTGRVAVAAAGEPVHAVDVLLGPLVEQPVAVPFEITAEDEGPVTLSISVLAPPTDQGRTVAYLHAWSVARS
jgi:hypothetical protein